MRKRSERVLELLKGGDILKQERLHALKITNQIQGFGNNALSPSSSSSSTPSSSRISNSSFGSFTTSSTWNEADEFSVIDVLKEKIPAKPKFEASHLWDPSAPIEEKDSLLNCEDEEEAEEGLHSYHDNKDGNVYEYNGSNQYGDHRLSGFLSGIRSKLTNVSPVGGSDHSERVAFRCISDVGRPKVGRTGRQLSAKYY